MAKTIAQLFDLNGQVAIVTGGAMGIGKGIALRLAEAGAAVMIADINVELADQTAEEIKASGGKAKAISGNTSLVSDAEKVVQAAISEFGDINILVNNAGIYRFMPAEEMTEDLWDRTLDINLKGTMFFSKAAARAMMKANHGGKIINIASVDGFRPTGNLVHYDASKGGVVMLTKALAKEWSPKGIHINAIAPGSVNTPGAAATMKGSKASPEELKALAAAFTENIPLRRSGEPDDIAKAVLFLASDAASYISGATIPVDGGHLAV